MSSRLDLDSAAFQHYKEFLAPLYTLYHHPIVSATPELVRCLLLEQRMGKHQAALLPTWLCVLFSVCPEGSLVDCMGGARARFCTRSSLTHPDAGATGDHC